MVSVNVRSASAQFAAIGRLPKKETRPKSKGPKEKQLILRRHMNSRKKADFKA
jgi:hypothetical protein